MKLFVLNKQTEKTNVTHHKYEKSKDKSSHMKKINVCGALNFVVCFERVCRFCNQAQGKFPS